MLKGIEVKSSESKKKVLEKFEKLSSDLQDGNMKNIADYKRKIKEIWLHLIPEQINALNDEIAKSLKFSQSDKDIAKEYCRKNRKISIRILGLPTREYPMDIESNWDEVLGELRDQDSPKMVVGSLVRLDVKVKKSGGVKQLIIANLLHSHEELDEEGKLECSETIVEDFCKDTFLPIAKVDSHKKNSLPSRRLKMFIKSGRKYAFHPDFDVEVPIFCDITEEQKGTWLDCTINIRSDRNMGLFRYYVTQIGDDK